MDDILSLAGVGYDRFTTNMRKTFDGMSPEKWIRLVIVVGTYCLLRPYIMKLGSKVQMAQHEKEAAISLAEDEAQAKMSPNELRGYKEIPDDDSDDDDADTAQVPRAQTTSTEWGKKARKRQRNTIKKILAAEEQRLQDLQDDEEDKDIEQYLT